ncbi:MAG: succinate dehydrogenase assembly factor 2 [Gammaproteobacteria bacterium]|nr:succinate dehydrogenase assembly factor 2 [Gammaproteobacteria bacterium]
MLELELKLVPFVRDCFAQLSAQEQVTYEAILAEEDWQIFDWLQQKEVPEDKPTKELINKIVQYHGCL